MSHKQFFLSDPHFGHENIVNFKDDEGKLVRPFKDSGEMDELIIQNWNSVVRSVDRGYLLGDIVINRRNLSILKRLNGKLVLLKGNHDIFKLKDYLPYFEDIRAYKVMPKHRIIFSHIPIHPYDLNERFKFNGHGHLHHNEIPDLRYINLCCEQLDYKPVCLEEILETIKVRERLLDDQEKEEGQA